MSVAQSLVWRTNNDASKPFCLLARRACPSARTVQAIQPGCMQRAQRARPQRRATAKLVPVGPAGAGVVPCKATYTWHHCCFTPRPAEAIRGHLISSANMRTKAKPSPGQLIGGGHRSINGWNMIFTCLRGIGLDSLGLDSLGLDYCLHTVSCSMHGRRRIP